MNENSDLGFSWLGTGLTSVIAFIQVNEIAQYITFGLGILTGIVSLAYTIYKWIHKALADKKIDESEMKELLDSLTATGEQIKATAEVIQDKNNE